MGRGRLIRQLVDGVVHLLERSLDGLILACSAEPQCSVDEEVELKVDFPCTVGFELFAPVERLCDHVPLAVRKVEAKANQLEPLQGLSGMCGDLVVGLSIYPRLTSSWSSKTMLSENGAVVSYSSKRQHSQKR